MIRKFSVTGQTALTTPSTPSSGANFRPFDASQEYLEASTPSSSSHTALNVTLPPPRRRPPLLCPTEKDVSTDEGLSMSSDDDHLTSRASELSKMLSELDIDHKLLLAAQRGETKLVRELLACGAHIITDEKGTTAMHIAARNGFAEVIRLLLESGVDVDIPDGSGCSALHKAASNGHLDVLELLITEGCSIDTQDDTYGNTPLHEAAWQGYSKSVDLLLKSKSNSFITNRAGCTALHLASQNGHNQSGRTLLYSGCSPDMKNNFGDSPIHTASRYGHAGIARILVSAKCSVNEQNKNGDTALHITAAFKRRKISKLLVDAGANSHLKNKQGETAVDIARRKDHPEIMDIIFDGRIDQPMIPQIGNRVADTRMSFINTQTAQASTIKDNGAEGKPAKKQKPFKSWIHKLFATKEKTNSKKVKSSDSGRGRNETPQDKSAGVVNQYIKKQGFAYYRDLAGNVRQGPCGFVPACPPSITDDQSKYAHLQETQNMLKERIESIQLQASQLNINLVNAEVPANKFPVQQSGASLAVEAERQEITKQLARVESDLHELRGDLASWLQTQTDETSEKPPQTSGSVKNDNPFAYTVGKNTTRFGDDFDHERMSRYEMTEQFPPPPRLFRAHSDETLTHSEYSYHGRAFKSREAAMAELHTLKQHEEMKAKRQKIRAGLSDKGTRKELKVIILDQSLKTSEKLLRRSSENLATSSSISQRVEQGDGSSNFSHDSDAHGSAARSNPSSCRSNASRLEKHTDVMDMGYRVAPIGANESDRDNQDETQITNTNPLPTSKLMAKAVKIPPPYDRRFSEVPSKSNNVHSVSSQNYSSHASLMGPSTQSAPTTHAALTTHAAPTTQRARKTHTAPATHTRVTFEHHRAMSDLKRRTNQSTDAPEAPVRAQFVQTTEDNKQTARPGKSLARANSSRRCRPVLPSYEQANSRNNTSISPEVNLAGGLPRPADRAVYMSTLNEIPANCTHSNASQEIRAVYQASLNTSHHQTTPSTDSGYDGAVTQADYNCTAASPVKYDPWYNERMRRNLASSRSDNRGHHKRMTSEV